MQLSNAQKGIILHTVLENYLAEYPNVEPHIALNLLEHAINNDTGLPDDFTARDVHEDWDRNSLTVEITNLYAAIVEALQTTE